MYECIYIDDKTPYDEPLHPPDPAPDHPNGDRPPAQAPGSGRTQSKDVEGVVFADPKLRSEKDANPMSRAPAGSRSHRQVLYAVHLVPERVAAHWAA